MDSEKRATQTNFAHLEAHDEQLVRLGIPADRYFPDDPNTRLLRIRQHQESLARVGVPAAFELRFSTRSQAKE